MRLPLIPQDKAAHAIYGALGSLLLIACGAADGFTPMLTVAVSGLICMGLSVAKELRDSRGYGTAEVWDVWASMAGWAVVAAAYLLGVWR